MDFRLEGLDKERVIRTVPSECGRVDILTSGSDPFNTTTGVVDNLYMGSDPLVSL
jgi:hypothetical protein